MISGNRRQQLHQLIDTADDRKIDAIYDFLNRDIQANKYTENELAGFYDTMNKYESGDMPGFSMEDAHAYVRKQKNS